MMAVAEIMLWSVLFVVVHFIVFAGLVALAAHIFDRIKARRAEARLRVEFQRMMRESDERHTKRLAEQSRRHYSDCPKPFERHNARTPGYNQHDL